MPHLITLKQISTVFYRVACSVVEFIVTVHRSIFKLHCSIFCKAVTCR
ncbi:hypothetical protein [Escherichia phage vB_EcoM_EP57]|nr:hypothetical protein [Escherichia phage vB_EcoM_EP57]